jgi:hypothetical protein
MDVVLPLSPGERHQWWTLQLDFQVKLPHGNREEVVRHICFNLTHRHKQYTSQGLLNYAPDVNSFLLGSIQADIREIVRPHYDSDMTPLGVLTQRS